MKIYKIPFLTSKGIPLQDQVTMNGSLFCVGRPPILNRTDPYHLKDDKFTETPNILIGTSPWFRPFEKSHHLKQNQTTADRDSWLTSPVFTRCLPHKTKTHWSHATTSNYYWLLDQETPRRLRILFHGSMFAHTLIIQTRAAASKVAAQILRNKQDWVHTVTIVYALFTNRIASRAVYTSVFIQTQCQFPENRIIIAICVACRFVGSSYNVSRCAVFRLVNLLLAKSFFPPQICRPFPRKAMT